MADKSFKKIDESDLENVNGGYIFDSIQVRDLNGYERFEVLDSKGNVIKKTASFSAAERIARERGESVRYLDWDELQRLRKTGSPDE